MKEDTQRGRNMNAQHSPMNQILGFDIEHGYSIEPIYEQLTTPINIIFTHHGDMLVADSGITDGNGKVLKLTNNGFKVIADGFNAPLTGITEHEGLIYVAHRRFVTVLDPSGKKTNIIEGLPSNGDHHNNRVVFGPDGKMYFGQGTATNSGVVGKDNDWVAEHPFFHDHTGSTVRLRGENFTTNTFLEEFENRTVTTGAYSPFGVKTYEGEIVNGIVRSNGSILRANPDGSELELVAWGLRNPFRINFDQSNRLFAANHGYDVRGSRPIANAPDEFVLIRHGEWYGFPDFSAGQPVTMEKFKPENMRQPTFLLAEHPMQPPKPFTTFAPHSATMGFSFNYNRQFGPFGDAYIAEFGSNAPITTGGKPLPRVGHRISRIDMQTGKVYNFIKNSSGLPASMSGNKGFERPIDAVFGPDGALYIADFAVFNAGVPEAKTGKIWRVTRM